ncbi:MAG: class I SAM-dependent methyltransferase [Sporocytophaga sp.]|nr:class I SAM-dependent methyltransferase [Sporocytophaga sp.]
MRNFLNSVFFRRSIDIIFSPLTFISCYWLRYIRTTDATKMPLSYNIFLKAKSMPVNDHYYEPMIDPYRQLKYSLRKDRNLPGIDLNIEGQIKFLSNLAFGDELLKFPVNDDGSNDFYYENGSFCSGDAEIYYSIIRHLKPFKIIEIGSGNSTIIAQKALTQNLKDNPKYKGDLLCIEPYEWPSLEKRNIQVIRKKVEELNIQDFNILQKNDILFIDSSHIIRPQGDVLFEYLEILPSLNSGVLIHIHDIFTPKDYLDDWIYNRRLFWNEQYLLEAFLTNNDKFEIIAAVNYLKHNYEDIINRVCPVMAIQPEREPCSIWLRKK